MLRKGISVVIIAKNEEERIGSCLKSVKDIADEIIVVDDCSTDRTVDVCKKIVPNVKIYKKMLDNFASQKNFGISKAKYEWILSLDADEDISKALSKRIKNLDTSSYDGFKIKMYSRGFHVDKLVPEYHLRLFRKNKGKYYGELHERVRVSGRVGKLEEPIIHYREGKDVSYWIRKMDMFSTRDALQYIHQGRDFDKAQLILRMILFPPAMFLYWYIYKGVFRHGLSGLIWAIGSSTIQFWKNVKYYEIKYHKPMLFKKEFGKSK